MVYRKVLAKYCAGNKVAVDIADFPTKPFWLYFNVLVIMCRHKLVLAEDDHYYIMPDVARDPHQRVKLDDLVHDIEKYLASKEFVFRYCEKAYVERIYDINKLI